MRNVQIVQTLVNIAGLDDLVVDGIAGPKTIAAILRLPADISEVLGNVYERVLRISWQDTLDSIVGGTDRDADVHVEIGRAAQKTGISPDILTALAKIESNLDPSAINGSYRGLFQMGAAAWESARLVASKFGVESHELGSYATSWPDPYRNALAAALFSHKNLETLKVFGYNGPWTAFEMYMAHQQGARGFFEIHNAASSVNRVSYARRNNMLNNPPQDGIGPTYVPLSFLQRWKRVVESKV